MIEAGDSRAQLARLVSHAAEAELQPRHDALFCLLKCFPLYTSFHRRRRKESVPVDAFCEMLATHFPFDDEQAWCTSVDKSDDIEPDTAFVSVHTCATFLMGAFPVYIRQRAHHCAHYGSRYYFARDFFQANASAVVIIRTHSALINSPTITGDIRTQVHAAFRRACAQRSTFNVFSRSNMKTVYLCVHASVRARTAFLEAPMSQVLHDSRIVVSDAVWRCTDMAPAAHTAWMERGAVMLRGKVRASGFMRAFHNINFWNKDDQQTERIAHILATMCTWAPLDQRDSIARFMGARDQRPRSPRGIIVADACIAACAPQSKGACE